MPPSAVCGKRFRDFVFGSPNPLLQARAVALLDAQIDGGFLLTCGGMPRAERAGRLPVARVGNEAPRLPPSSGAALDARWPFPHRLSEAVAHMRTSGACGPIIAPTAP